MDKENTFSEATGVEAISRRLMEAREAKGLTIEQVEKETSIRKIYLRAIEAGDLAAIPGEVFIKGILRTYGNFLGLDGVKLVEEYKHTTKGEEINRNDNNAIREATGVKVVPSFKPNNEYAESNKGKLVYGLIAALAVLIGACAFYYFVYSPSQRATDTKAATETAATKATEAEKPANTATKPADPAKAAAKPQDSAKPAANAAQAQTATSPQSKAEAPKAQAAPVAPAAQKGKVQVDIAMEGNCWLQVKEGDKLLFEGMVNPKQPKSFTSTKGLTIVYGNNRAARVRVNGQEQPNMNSDNPVVTKSYPVK